MLGHLIPELLLGMEEDRVIIHAPSALERLMLRPHFYSHFQGTEIECKLTLVGNIYPSDKILRILERRLVKAGAVFLESDVVVRDNYSIYYKRYQGMSGKIVARSLGNSGFQVKLKARRVQDSKGSILVRDEIKSKILPTLESAEKFLEQTLGVIAIRDYIESIVRIKKYKLIFKISNSRSVFNFFELIVDETSIVASQNIAVNVEDTMRQIEVEYLGSSSPELDKLQSVIDELDRIIGYILEGPDIQTSKTVLSKRDWAMTKKV